jgi:hypothetical protein
MLDAITAGSSHFDSRNNNCKVGSLATLSLQSGDPDYQGMSREEAEADFRRRIDAYERVYQSVTEPDLSFCRIMNVGERVTINRIQGYLQSRIAFYLMNLVSSDFPFYVIHTFSVLGSVPFPTEHDSCSVGNGTDPSTEKVCIT